MTIKHKKKKKHFEKDYQIENRRLNKLCQKKKKRNLCYCHWRKRNIRYDINYNNLQEYGYQNNQAEKYDLSNYLAPMDKELTTVGYKAG